MKHAPLTSAFLIALLLAGCGGTPPKPDTAVLPPGAFGVGINDDVGLINFAQYDWADAARLANQPQEGARAVAALDYLAGALNTDPRWQSMPALTQQQLLQARKDVRAVLGIAPGASSQSVVDHLARVYAALGAGDKAAAAAALNSPEFTLGPAATLTKLGALPYVQSANIATTHAAGSMFGPGEDGANGA